MRNAGILRRFVGFFALGSAPDSSSEEREHLRLRLSLYFRVLFLILAVLYGLVVLLVTIGGQYEALTRPERWAHVAVIAVTFAAWMFTRDPTRSRRALDAVDAAGTTLVGLGVGLFGGLEAPVVLLMDIYMVLVLAQTFLARAAIVPSSASRTLAIGFAGSAPLAVAFVRAALIEGPRSDTPAIFLFLEPITWMVISVLLTGLTSRVIYGLRRRIASYARLGQYTLGEKLGEGGMGVVYRAEHAMLKRPAALKLLPLERSGTRAIARFEREVQVTATLTHPNTIAIYDFGRTPEGIFYYVMEYLDGMDLEALVRAGGAQPAGRVVHILKQVTGALAEAHGAGLIHRDIKPANIILTPRGASRDWAKVVDFGLVRDLSGGPAAQSMANEVQGTPLYISPEAITAPETVDGRSDAYALGAVAYFLLTGTPVFSGTSVIDLFGHHLHTAPHPPSATARHRVTPALDALVLSLLAKDPAGRPQSAEVLLAALDGLEGISPWTPDDAAAWWAAHPRKRPAAPMEGTGMTLAVEVTTRG